MIILRQHEFARRDYESLGNINKSQAITGGVTGIIKRQGRPQPRPNSNPLSIPGLGSKKPTTEAITGGVTGIIKRQKNK